MTNRYTEVEAISTLPLHHYLYEANIDLRCAKCGATIPVNSYFARKLAKGATRPQPHCRTCRPFKIFTSPQRTSVAPRDEEYHYITGGE